MYHKHKRSLKPKDGKQFLILRLNQASIWLLFGTYTLAYKVLTRMSLPHLRQFNLNFQSRNVSLFWKTRWDAQGIRPIRDPLTNTYQTANEDGANIINRQFQSTFTQLSESTVLDGLADGTITEKTVSGTFRPKVPEMQSLIISLAGILKMLDLEPLKVCRGGLPLHEHLRAHEVVLYFSASYILSILFMHKLNRHKKWFF